MKLTAAAILTLFSCMALGQKDFGYLKKEDQKFFQNDSMEGNNQFERIDLNVKEINKLHSEVAALKLEIQNLKNEMKKLKGKQ